MRNWTRFGDLARWNVRSSVRAWGRSYGWKTSLIDVAASAEEIFTKCLVSLRVALYDSLHDASAEFEMKTAQGHVLFTLGAQISTKTHGDCTSCQLSEASEDDNPDRITWSAHDRT